MEEDSERVNVKISGRKQQRIFSLSDVRTVENLDLPSQTLGGLLIQFYSNQSHRMLIGIDHLKLIVPLKVREGIIHYSYSGTNSGKNMFREEERGAKILQETTKSIGGRYEMVYCDGMK
uniref:Uncharacterized protein n=1 Tax=Anopheles epiroticus TaxID=199890 RepID=A0A182PWT1_9DIPT